jgi:hypothetical protein
MIRTMKHTIITLEFRFEKGPAGKNELVFRNRETEICKLLQGRAGFAAQKVALFDLFVAAAADQGDLDDFFRGVTPAVVLYAYQLTAVAPCVREWVPVVIQVTEEAQIFPINQVLAHECFMADSMLVTANRCQIVTSKKEAIWSFPRPQGRYFAPKVRVFYLVL